MEELKLGGPQWAIVKPLHGWYHVSRVIFVDGTWFELYWNKDHKSRPSKARLAREAKDDGLRLLPGIFRPNGYMNALVQT